MRILRPAAALIALASASLAQVDRHLWIPTDSAIHELDQAGNILASYPQSCFSVSGCSNRVARDGMGNVYIGQLGSLAPGVAGWIKAFRSGVGETAVVHEPTQDLLCDAGNLVWRLMRRMVDPATQRTITYLVRSSPGLVSHSYRSLGATAASIAAHSGGGVWLATADFTSGPELRRVSSSMVLEPPLTLPGRILAMASDDLPRVWLADELGNLHRASDPGAGAPVLDWSIPIGGNAASLHVDLCGTVHVHVPGASSSTVLRFTADGVALPSISLPRTMALSVGTGGGYAYLRQSGFNQSLVQIDAVGSTATPLGSVLGGVIGGDLTGAAWCASASPLLDSDGDGFDNAEETRRGTDLFDAASHPPTLAWTPTGGPVPPTWSLVFSDPDPDHRGLFYQMALSASANTGFSVPANGLCPIVPIDLDGLLLASLQPSPLWSGFGGTIDAQGRGVGTLRFPPGLPSGIPLYLAGVTLSPTSGALVVTSAAVAVRTP